MSDAISSAIICHKTIDDLQALIDMGCRITESAYKCTMIVNSKWDIFRFLVERGTPNTYSTVTTFFTHVIHARDYRFTEEQAEVLKKLPVTSGPSIVDAICKLSYNKNLIQCVQLLLELGADINAISSTGTALSNAVRRYNMELVQFLLDNGADVSVTTDSGDNALNSLGERGYALCSDYFPFIKLLISAGLDINQPNKKGLTLLMKVLYHEGPQSETAKFLIENGAYIHMGSPPAS